MTNEAPEEERMSDRLTAAQVEKLMLEIEGLKNQNRWEVRTARYIPLLTVLIAVGGFLFGFYQFQAQQKLHQGRMILEQQKERESREREQALRVQESIRRNVEQLLHFTSDERLTIAQAIFIMHDLDVLLGSNANQRRNITQSITEMISRDNNFSDNQRDSQFAISIFNYWRDYSEFLKDNQNKIMPLLDRFIEGLDKLHDQDPKSYENITYESEKKKFFGSWGNNTKEYRHFSSLISLFEAHINLLADERTKEEFLQQFQEELCNPTLTKQLFNINFINSGRCSAKPENG